MRRCLTCRRQVTLTCSTGGCFGCHPTHCPSPMDREWRTIRDPLGYCTTVWAYVGAPSLPGEVRAA